MIDTSAFQISQKIQPKKEQPSSKLQKNEDKQSFASALSDKMNARDTVDSTKKQGGETQTLVTHDTDVHEEAIVAQDVLVQTILAMLGASNPAEQQASVENVQVNTVEAMPKAESIAEIPIVAETLDVGNGIIQSNAKSQTDQISENLPQMQQIAEPAQTFDTVLKGGQELPQAENGDFKVENSNLQVENNNPKDALPQIDKSNSNQLETHPPTIDNTKPTQSVEVKEAVSNPIVAETKIQTELADKPILKQESQNTDVSGKNVADNGLGSEAKIVKSQTPTQNGNLSDGNAEQESGNAKNENTLSAEKESKTILLTGHDLKRTSVDTTFVKISDAATKLDAGVPVQTQVVDAIKTQINNGKTEFIMHLNPQSLGKVAVKLVMEAGMLTVELIADNPKTQSLLAANAGEIKELVQASTNNNTQIISSNQSENLQQNYTQQESQNENRNNQQSSSESADNPSDHEKQAAPIEFYSVLQQLSQQARIRTMV